MRNLNTLDLDDKVQFNIQRFTSWVDDINNAKDADTFFDSLDSDDKLVMCERFVEMYNKLFK